MSEVKKILIIDDEPILRECFIDFFNEDEIWQPLQAKNGLEALKIVENESPDFVIIDLHMAEMDGVSFIHKVNKKNKKMVCFISTGSLEYEIPEELKKYTCLSSHILRKPIDFSELENFLKDALIKKKDQ